MSSNARKMLTAICMCGLRLSVLVQWTIIILCHASEGVTYNNEVMHSDEYRSFCQEWYMRCTNKDVLLRVGHCMTYEEGEGTLAMQCPYFELKGHNIAEPGYIKLPNNISELNDYMCRHMNRRGWLCKDCIEGFGPSVTSIGYKCSNCTAVTWFGLPLYLLQEFLPITVFYLIILVFRIHLASAPMTCFIMYSQLRAVAIVNHPNPTTNEIVNEPVFKLAAALHGVWNLDFFRYALPPFCVSSSLQLTHIILLNYISCVYPIILILLTWICIELHDRNFRPLVWLWRPFHGCFVRLRRGWDTRRDIVDVFASCFLLSFSKLTYQSMILINCPLITRLDEESNMSYGHVMAYNPNISCKSTNVKYLLITIFASLSILVFNILPALLLVLHPIKIFKTCLSKCKLDGLALTTFVEKFHGCYRDGLDGRKDMRSFAGLYFFLRFVPLVFTVDKLTIPTTDWSYVVFIFLAATILIALVRPYKENYMNIIDTFLLADITFMSYLYSMDYFSSKAMQVMILTNIPTLLFGCFVLYKVLLKTRHRLAQCCQKCSASGRQSAVERSDSVIDETCIGQSQPLLPPTSVTIDIKSDNII